MHMVITMWGNEMTDENKDDITKHVKQSKVKVKQND